MPPYCRPAREAAQSWAAMMCCCVQPVCVVTMHPSFQLVIGARGQSQKLENHCHGCESRGIVASILLVEPTKLYLVYIT